MTLKLCVLGNSHVAAYKDGWPPKGIDKGTVEADFAGCLKNGMASFGKRDDGLYGPLDQEAASFFAAISTTGDFIRVEEYDAFILAGMKFFPNGIFRNYANFATPDTHNHDSASQMVSNDVLEAALWDELNGGMMLHVARTLKSATNTPVFIAWQPHLSAGLMDIDWRANLYQPILANGDAPFVDGMMARIDARLVQEGLHVLHQPKSTLDQGIMTARKWSDGSRQFREGGGSTHRAQDVFHMNAEFGAASWKDWLASSPLKNLLPSKTKRKSPAKKIV